MPSGNVDNNAPMEGFSAALKTELAYLRQYNSRRDAKADIFEYIEVFYNRHGLHSALGYLSPFTFEF